MDFIEKECELTVTRKFMFTLDKLVSFRLNVLAPDLDIYFALVLLINLQVSDQKL